MPNSQLSRVMRPILKSAFPGLGLAPDLPADLCYEAGVLWGMGTPPNAGNDIPIAFNSANSFVQCMRIIITGRNVKNITIGTGSGPHGVSFQVAQWTLVGPSTTNACAYIATSSDSPGIIQSFLASGAWPARGAGLIFPASCFTSVTANLPLANTKVPSLPLILVSAVPASQTVLGGGLIVAPYFVRS